MRPPTEQLRSIVKKSDEDPEKTKKKRGKKRQHGVRFGGTGGSDLISTSDEVPGPSTQTAEFGQTCQPRTSSKISQAIGCLRCDGLGHVATICTNTPTAANAGRPPAYYCHSCSMTYKYTSQKKLMIEVDTCTAHNRDYVPPEDPAKTEKMMTAALLLQKIEQMVARGTPLPDALRSVGISQDKFKKIKKCLKV